MEHSSPTESPLEVVQRIGSSLADHARQIDETRDLPDAVFDQLIDHDLFRLLLPRELGGQQTDPLAFVALIEEMGKYDASTAWCLGQNNVCSTVAAYLAPEAAKAIFRSPRDILAWGPGPGEAQVVDGGFVLNGRFDFASGSRHATWLGAHVPVNEKDGTRRSAPNGDAAPFTLIFPKASVAVRDTWHVLGLRGTGSDSYDVTDLFVPESMSMMRHALVKPRSPQPLYAFTSSLLYSSSFASLALGIARATLDAFVDDVRDSIPRGASKSRGANNVVQREVGESEARIRSARSLLRNTLAECWDRAERDGELTEELRVSLRLATTWAIQQSRETVSALYLAAGAMAVFESRPFERRFRDIHTLCQQIQGHAAHFETVGQILMGMEPDRPIYSF